jgi:hypothetical protein
MSLKCLTGLLRRWLKLSERAVCVLGKHILYICCGAARLRRPRTPIYANNDPHAERIIVADAKAHFTKVGV